MPSSPRKSSASNAEPSGDSAWSILDGIALALFITRWFVPAEGVSRGETLWIAQAWTIWGALAAYRAFRLGDRWTLQLSGWAVGTTALVIGHLVSALVVCATEGQKRAALNGLWEWVSVGVALCWVASGAKRPEFRRVVTLSVISAAATLSLLGLWQRHVWQPRLAGWVTEYDQLEARVNSLTGTERRSAERRLEELRDELGPEYVSLDANGRFAMRQRVQFSTEPLGRFALANTLASLLAVGFVVGLPMLSGAGPPRSKILAAAMLLLIAYVLLLTKSRTAMIGTAFGTVAFLVLAFGFLSQRLARWMACITATVVVLIGVAWLTGGLDRLVISEAPKSLRYRTEYWRGSADVVREHPWLGVGPGNFRQHYLRYKLPESSEEILDPHNLLLDAWVNGGLLAAAVVIGLVVMGLWRMSFPVPPTTVETMTSSLGRKVAGAFVLAAAIVLLRRWAFEGIVDWQVLLLGVGSGIVGLLLVRASAFGGSLEFAALSAAWLTLTIHLLGAGGMEMPAVVQTWLALMCLKVASVDARTRTLTVGRRAALGLAFAMAIVATAQWWTATFPALECRTFSDAAEAAISRGNFRGAQQRLKEAIDADPLDPEPRRRLAQVHFGAWRESREQSEFDIAIRVQQEAIARDPANPHDHRILGEIYLAKFERDREADAARQAVEWLTIAAEKYPNHAPTQASLARAHEAAGDKALSREAAAKAIRLDALNRELGHYDRLLPDSDLPGLKALAE
jgi:tetratricopeptide (TPR) repeat protein